VTTEVHVANISRYGKIQNESYQEHMCVHVYQLLHQIHTYYNIKCFQFVCNNKVELAFIYLYVHKFVHLC